MYTSHAHLPSIGLKKLATEDANSRLLIIVLDLQYEIFKIRASGIPFEINSAFEMVNLFLTDGLLRKSEVFIVNSPNFIYSCQIFCFRDTNQRKKSPVSTKSSNVYC